MTAPLSTPRDLFARVFADGDRDFMVSPAGTRSLGALAELVKDWATRFAEQRIGRDNTVVISLPDEADAISAFLAAMITGVVPSLVSVDSGPERLSSICAKLDAALVIVEPDRDIGSWAGPRCAAGHGRGGLARLFGLGRTSRADLRRPVPVEVDPDDTAYVLFTSGTTAEPSGVRISWRNLSSHLATLIRLFGFGPGTRVCNPTPVTHTDGLVFGPLLALASGGTLLRPGPFSVGALDDWLGRLASMKATHLVTNPTVLALVDRYATGPAAFGDPEFRGVVCSASSLRPDFWARLEERFGLRIWNLYGLTETVTTALYAGRHPEMGAIGSIGVPIDCEARLGDDTGAALPGMPGAEGEIQLRGDHIFPGYWRNPARDAQTFTADGWMRTGDLGRLRADGSYDFLGRRKAAINCGGTLIRGEEIDECLLRHPKVAEAVTVALPDPDFEEIPVSAVVLSGPASEAELAEHARRSLEQLRQPRRIFVVDRIPRGESGKPRLEELRRNLQGLMTTTLVGTDDTATTILALAAEVFSLDTCALSVSSSPDDVPGWDSFTHLNLVLAAERAFGIRIPAARVAAIRSLGDLAACVRAGRS